MWLNKVIIMLNKIIMMLNKIILKKKNKKKREPAVSVMAMLLDSHVVDRGSRPEPGGLKLTPGACACVPERRMEEKGLRHDHPSWGVISRFLSLCLSLSVWPTHAPYSEKSLQKKIHFLFFYFFLYTQSHYLAYKVNISVCEHFSPI